MKAALTWTRTEPLLTSPQAQFQEQQRPLKGGTCAPGASRGDDGRQHKYEAELKEKKSKPFVKKINQNFPVELRPLP